MRNVRNKMVNKVALLALTVAGFGFGTSETYAQAVQCNPNAVSSTCAPPVTQSCPPPVAQPCVPPVVYFRNTRGHTYESPNALRARMESVGTRIQADVNASPEWITADAEVQQATADIETAEARIRQSLADRPDYQAAVDEKQAAEQLVATLRQSGAEEDRIVAAAQEALEAAKTVTQIEQQASTADQPLIDARARLQNAAVVRQGLQAATRAAVLNNPHWQRAERRLDRF